MCAGHCTSLYKEGFDGIIRRCVPEYEQEEILRKCHSSPYGGHHVGDELHTKCYNQVFIGLLYSRMQENLFYLAMNAKELLILVDVMKCLRIILLLLNLLIVGDLTLWSFSYFPW